MESYGYRFDTPDRSIVISGDTNPTQATIDACNGCDVLIHEAHPPLAVSRSAVSKEFAEKYHTTPRRWPISHEQLSRGCYSFIMWAPARRRTACLLIYVRAIQACSPLRETWMYFRSSRTGTRGS